MNISHYLLPGEDILAAPARWHFLYKIGANDHSIVLSGFELGGRSPHDLFDKRLSKHQRELRNIGWSGSFEKHDLSNYQSAFLKPEEFLCWQQHHSLSTYGSHSTHVSHWRWCPDCVVEDTDKYGVPYFHRDHQLPGVFRCHKHNQALVEKCSSCGWHVCQLKDQSIPPFDNTCPSCSSNMYGKSPAISEAINAIEKASLSLVETQYEPKRLRLLQESVRLSAGVNVYSENTMAERKKLSEWLHEFYSYFSKYELNAWFKKLESSNGIMISPLMSNSRITKVNSLAKPLHPLAHLLVEHFLTKTTGLMTDEQHAA